MLSHVLYSTHVDTSVTHPEDVIVDTSLLSFRLMMNTLESVKYIRESQSQSITDYPFYYWVS